MPKIDITVGNHSVSVEDHGSSLEEVSVAALKLFKETAPAGPLPSTDQTSMGFANTERIDQGTYDSGYQIH